MRTHANGDATLWQAESGQIMPGSGMRMDTAWITKRLSERSKTITDLAAAVNRDRAAMSRVVNDQQPLSLPMAPIVAAELGVGVLELISRSGLPGVQLMSAAPIIPWHRAGALADAPGEVIFERGPSVEIPANSRTLVALEITEPTMDRVAPPGSTIVVDYSRKALSNHALGLFVAGGSTVVFARYNQDHKGAWLTHDSHDPRYAQSVIQLSGAPLVIGPVVSVPILTMA